MLQWMDYFFFHFGSEEDLLTSLEKLRSIGKEVGLKIHAKKL